MHLVDLDPIKQEQEPEPVFNPDEDIFFVLFTRRNPTVGQRLGWTVGSISGSHWNSAALGTRFIIHGWNNNHQSDVNTVIAPAFLAAADHNVVAIDWGVGAQNINYVFSRNQVPAVATVIARFIDFLHEHGFLVNFNRLILTGHSLGAQ